MPNARTRSNGSKLEHEGFSLNIRKSFCAVHGALPQAAQRLCGVSTLEIFKTYLDMVLSNLFWVTLLEQGWDQMGPEAPSHLSYPVIV